MAAKASKRKSTNAQRLRVVTLATLKGGAGKSSVAAALAIAWHKAGRPAALIDGDPQASLVRWHARADGEAATLRVAQDTTEQIQRTVADLSNTYTPLVLDTPGFRSKATILAMAAADLVLIPCRASPHDVEVAAETYGLVHDVNRTPERRDRPVLARVLLTMTAPGTLIAKHIRAELESAGYPVLQTELASRVAWPEAALSGSTPTLTEPRGAAAREIRDLVAEVEALATLLPA